LEKLTKKTLVKASVGQFSKIGSIYRLVIKLVLSMGTNEYTLSSNRFFKNCQGNKIAKGITWPTFVIEIVMTWTIRSSSWESNFHPTRGLKKCRLKNIHKPCKLGIKTILFLNQVVHLPLCYTFICVKYHHMTILFKFWMFQCF
jgi:hypothetical protein